MVYQHYKGGKYTRLFNATDSTNGRDSELMVVYVSHTTGRINTRKATEFEEMVEWPDGVVRPRFTPVHVLEDQTKDKGKTRCPAAIGRYGCTRPEGHAGPCNFVTDIPVGE